jgi:hypothetical protein
MFVSDLLYRHSDEIKKNITALHSLTYIQLQFTKVNLRRVIRVYLEIEPKEALEKIKYFLKKLNLNPNDEILNKYPIIKEFIQKELNTSQLMDYKEYLKYDDFNFSDNYFYKNLIEEINKCYSVGAYSAVRILTRKLLENLLIDILKKKYYGKDDDKFYNKNDGRFHGFNTLLKNFKEAFKDDSVITNNELGKLISILKKFKEEGDINAHSIIVKPEKSEIDREKEHLIYLISALTKIYNDIKE